ncbi:UNVERIFIED_CONTAM: TIGR00730 family Rossman fold protein, partial [Cronobacter sakazakii]
MNSICIFCGSSLGSNPIFQQIAQLTGEAIAKQGKTLVYGGGRSGLMG